MKIQEQFINIAKDTEYWKVYFEFINEKQLTKLQWELINNMIKKMLYEIENGNNL